MPELPLDPEVLPSPLLLGVELPELPPMLELGLLLVPELELPEAPEPLVPEVPLLSEPVELELVPEPLLLEPFMLLLLPLEPVSDVEALLLACFFLAFRLVCLVDLVDDAPVESVAVCFCDCISCAFCSTSAALAGSVLVVTPLEELCANVAPAIENREINTAWEIFFMVAP